MSNIINSLKKDWEANGKGQRFGQWFINNFVKDESKNEIDFAKLFYLENAREASEMIMLWCSIHEHYNELPVKVR